MKLFLFTLALLYSAPTFAAFSCKIWNTPIGSGDTFTFELKPVSPQERYMQEITLHDLHVITMLNGANSSYAVEASQVGGNERSFFLHTDLPFFADSKLTFRYPVKALDIVELNVQCTL